MTEDAWDSVYGEHVRILENEIIGALSEKEIGLGWHPKRVLLVLLIFSIVMMFAAFTSGYIVRRDEGNWRDNRSHSRRILLFHQGFVLFAIPIVADLDDAGIFAKVHAGGGGFA